MRIINRQQFLALPAGVVYCKYEPCIFGAVEMKGDTAASGNDWYITELNNLWVDDIDDSGAWVAALDDMQHNGASYPLGSMEARDGHLMPSNCF